MTMSQPEKNKLQDLMTASITMGKIEAEAIDMLKALAYSIAERRFKIPTPNRQKFADIAIKDIQKIWKQFNPKVQNAASFFETSINISIIEAQRNE